MQIPDGAMHATKAKSYDDFSRELIAFELEQIAQSERRDRVNESLRRRGKRNLIQSLKVVTPSFDPIQRLKAVAYGALAIVSLSSFKPYEKTFDTTVSIETSNTQELDYKTLRDGRLDIYPVVEDDTLLTSITGPRKLPKWKKGTRDHQGNDFSANAGARVLSPIYGVVTERKGLVTKIENPAYSATFRHLRPRLSIGDSVNIGDTVGVVVKRDPSDSTYTSHAHIELRWHNKNEDKVIDLFCRLNRDVRYAAYSNIEENNQISGLKFLEGVDAPEKLERRCQRQINEMVYR